MAEDLNQRKKDLDEIKKKIDAIEKDKANYDKRTNDNLRLKAKYQREVNKLREEEATLAEEIANAETTSASSVRELNKLAAKNVRLAKTKAAIILRSVGLESKSPDFIKKATLATEQNIKSGYTALEKLRQEAISTFQTDPEAFDLEDFQSKLEEIKGDIDMSADGADELLKSIDLIDNQFEGAADESEKIKNLLESELPFLDTLNGLQEGLENIVTIIQTPLALFAVAFAGFLKVAKDAVGAVKEVRDELGTSVMDSAKLAMNMKLASIQATILGGKGEDAASAVKALAEFTGRTDNLSFSASQNFGKLAAFTGASAESLAKAVEFTRLAGGFTRDRAIDELLALEALTDAEGVLSSQVFEDVADSAQNSALFFGKTADEIGRAAIEMRKLGIGASALQSVAESILDLETSIGKEFELQVLFGKRINLDRARQLAFQRKGVELAQELKRQLGGQFELNKANFAQVQALTSGLGLTQEQIQKLIQGQDVFNDKAKESSGIFKFIIDNAIFLGIVVGGIVGLLGSIGPAILAGFGLVKTAARNALAVGKTIGIGIGAGAAAGGTLGVAAKAVFGGEPKMENMEAVGVTRKGVLDGQGIGANLSLGDNVFLAADKRTQNQLDFHTAEQTKEVRENTRAVNEAKVAIVSAVNEVKNSNQKIQVALNNIVR